MINLSGKSNLHEISLTERETVFTPVIGSYLTRLGNSIETRFRGEPGHSERSEAEVILRSAQGVLFDPASIAQT